MQIKINAKIAEIPQNSSVQDLLMDRKLAGNSVIVVLNEEIVHREKWASLKFTPGDSLEIIHMIGGG
jgi:sulfur carrier protein